MWRGSRWEGEVNYLCRGHGGRGDWNGGTRDISHGYPPESLAHTERGRSGKRGYLSGLMVPPRPQTTVEY